MRCSAFRERALPAGAGWLLLNHAVYIHNPDFIIGVFYILKALA